MKTKEKITFFPTMEDKYDRCLDDVLTVLNKSKLSLKDCKKVLKHCLDLIRQLEKEKQT